MVKNIIKIIQLNTHYLLVSSMKGLIKSVPIFSEKSVIFDDFKFLI